MLRAVILPFIFLVCGAAGAVTQEQVVAGAERMYRERIAEVRGRSALDTDARFLERLQQIAQVLIRRAASDYPQTAGWAWEIHASADPNENAFCMAGGKLLVGQRFVQDLSLDDAELAMLLAHEMQHAIQEHNLKEYQEALRLEPGWTQRPFAELESAVDNDNALMRKLDGFNAAQEVEADREGLKLAWRAGWPAMRLANYFKKLSRASASPNFDSRSHPASARRWQAARELAAALDKEPLESPPR
ncbi:M48 family metalloprotease [Undibacterium sp.]|jgi:predicted Zn-dependent protease|uniref:M48 family metalloprotease n=1 Tax=Undibacterium sp. TaxID=1914977 RepID=UPI002C678B67|nr:M48 family metalloprotease [Undibacterium sp.]HTD04420.1 M48 family metalloprotease [Undibacterium sp.]